MGDMGEVFSAMRAATKQRHADWKKANMEILGASGAIFTVTNCGETLMFRMSGKPKVDFYPSTGRWRVVGNGQQRPMSGGAQKFLNWYAEQSA